MKLPPLSSWELPDENDAANDVMAVIEPGKFWMCALDHCKKPSRCHMAGACMRHEFTRRFRFWRRWHKYFKSLREIAYPSYACEQCVGQEEWRGCYCAYYNAFSPGDQEPIPWTERQLRRFIKPR